MFGIKVYLSHLYWDKEAVTQLLVKETPRHCGGNLESNLMTNRGYISRGSLQWGMPMECRIVLEIVYTALWISGYGRVINEDRWFIKKRGWCLLSISRLQSIIWVELLFTSKLLDFLLPHIKDIFYSSVVGPVCVLWRSSCFSSKNFPSYFWRKANAGNSCNIHF